MTVQAPRYIDKLKGEKTRSGLPYPSLRDILIAGIGGFLITSLLNLLHVEWKVLLCFIVPFGASAVLVFAAPAAPFSQPRNVIGGHVLSALVGVIIMTIFKTQSWWVLALANALAISLMVATKTVHPPAGATVFLPILSQITNFTWVLTPVLVGALIIVVLGLLYNNVWERRRYPAFWW